MPDGYISQVTLPNGDTYAIRNDAVTLSGNAENKDYPILLKNTNTTTDETAGVKYSNNVSDTVTVTKPFTYNPSTGILKASKIQIGIKDDTYGFLPYANNWNSLGANNLYWYRVYATNHYGTTSYITNWTSNNNIGTAATTSAAATLGKVNFYNTCAANGTQTKTTLTADSTANSNITLTMPKVTGTLALTSDITSALTNYLPLAGGTMTGAINRYHSAASSDPMLTLRANNQDAYLFLVGHATAADGGFSNHYALLYVGTGTSPNNYLLLKASNGTTTVTAAQWDETGNASYNGEAHFNLGTSNTSSNNRKFTILGESNNKMSIAPTGIQVYNSSNAVTTLYLQAYGGNMIFGSSSYLTATRDMYGVFDFKSSTGFTYSGIGAGSENTARPIWFAFCSGGTITRGRPVYDDDFKYNPSTNTITIGTGTLSATAYSGNAANVTGTIAIDHGGTGKTTAAEAWTALGGGASGKHADSYFVTAITSTDNAIVRYNGTSGLVLDSGLIINDNDMLTIPGGSKVYSVGSVNQSGYVKWATLTISGSYQNEPIVFEISRRGDAMSTIIQVQFLNTSSSDPTLTSFTYYGSCANIYIKKSATSTWDLYASKTENYDLLCVLRYHNPYNSKINVEWKSEHITDAVADWTLVSIAPIKVSGSNISGTVAKATAANLTTTANAIAYYTNTTGTFGYKASANGALYATSANGALNWGTLPVAQGGTGATDAATARANLGVTLANIGAAASSHTHGNILNNGTLTNANRLVWTDGDKKIYAGYHYANSTKIAINSTSEPTENLYVSGKIQFNVSTTSSGDKNFIIKKTNDRYLSIGCGGLLSYNADNTVGTMWLLYSGGILEIGTGTVLTSTTYNATTANITWTTANMTGAYNFKTANTGFNFSGMGAGSDSVARNVWFSYNGLRGTPVYDDDFKYNPSTNVLTIGKLTITGGTSDSSLSTEGAMSMSSASSKTFTISSGSTFYINKPTNASIIFTHGGADTNHEIGRFDTSGNFVPKSGTTYTIGTSTLKWTAIYATNFYGGGANITLSTASRAVVTDSNSKLSVSSVTSTELGYLSGVTSAIQTQLNGKMSSSTVVNKVKTTAKTDNVNYKILGCAAGASPASGTDYEAIYDVDIMMNPSTNTITASTYALNSNGTITYNSSNGCVEIIV